MYLKSPVRTAHGITSEKRVHAYTLEKIGSRWLHVAYCACATIAWLTALGLKQWHWNKNTRNYPQTKDMCNHALWWTKQIHFSTKLSLHIARNQGHFEPTNNCQLYIILHSRTIYHQEIQYCSDHRFDLLFTPTEFAFNAWFGSLDRD